MQIRYLLLLMLVPALVPPAAGHTDLTVTATNPQANALNVPREPFIDASFSQIPDPETIHPNLMQVRGLQTGPVTGDLFFSADSLTLLLLPAPRFAPGELIEARIIPPLSATSGDTLAHAHIWHFRIAAERGAGIFPDSLSLAMRYGAVAAEAGDLNGDDALDIVMTYLADLVTVLICAEIGPDSLPEYERYDFTMGESHSSVALADFNEDGHLDIAAADQFGNVMRIGLNGGDGTTYDWSTTPTCDHPQRIKCGDLNGDGHTDIAYPCQWSDNMNILLGDGAGSFYATGTYPLPVYPSDIGMRDVDLDGDLDLVTINRYTDPMVYLLCNTDPRAPVNEMFTPICSTAVAGSQGLLLEDLDGDHYPDALVASEDSARIAFCRFDPGTGCFADPIFYPTGGGPTDRVRNAAPLDFDGDGDLDLAVTDSDNNHWLLMQNDGWGGFSVRAIMPTQERPITPATADLDADGIVDVIVPTRIAGTLDLFFAAEHFLAIDENLYQTRLVLAAHPNPFREHVMLRCAAPLDEEACIEICDVAGRILRRQETRQPAWVWDGRDQDGRRVPAGTYLLRWSAGEAHRDVRILKIQ